MTFGYITDDAQLDRTDFTLPPDDAGNARILALGAASGLPQQVYVGCAEYRVKEWKGLLYPPKTKEADMLERYAQQFRLMEMNGTHYRIYDGATIQKWTDKVGGDFRFLPKFPQAISHEGGGFQQLEATTAAFLESVRYFEPHLGPLFLQMSEYDSPAGRQQLFRYLATLPDDLTYFIELRHPQWFGDAAIRAELLTALRDLNIGLVINDAPARRDVCHMALTIPKVMVRFVGRHRHPSTQRRIDDWAQRLRYWLGAGLREMYFVAHTGLTSPLTAADISLSLNNAIGLSLPLPHLLPAGEPSPGELF